MPLLRLDETFSDQVVFPSASVDEVRLRVYLSEVKFGQAWSLERLTVDAYTNVNPLTDVPLATISIIRNTVVLGRFGRNQMDGAGNDYNVSIVNAPNGAILYQPGDSLYANIHIISTNPDITKVSAQVNVNGSMSYGG
jgi:hypothetical protein